MEVRLTIVGGKASRKAVTVKLPAVIGRSREADLTVGHPMVSRRHCELFEAQGLVRIRDLGSLNGTLVGGKEITEAPLRPDDEFSIGPLTFRVEYDYAGDVTVVAPIVPEEPPTPAPPIPSAGDVAQFSSLVVENPRQFGPTSSGVLEDRSAGERADVPSASVAPCEEMVSEPDAPAQSENGGATGVPTPSRLGSAEEPVAPAPSFGGWAPPQEPPSPEAGLGEPPALSQPALGTEGGSPVEAGGLFADFPVPEGDQIPLVELPSEPSLFGSIQPEQPATEDVGKEKTGAGAGPSGNREPPELMPAEAPTVLAGLPESPVASDSIFEPAQEDQSAGFEEAAWLESGPSSQGAVEGTHSARSVPPSGPPVKKARTKGLWRWWPFGRRKTLEQSGRESSEDRPVAADRPASESAVAGASAPVAPPPLAAGVPAEPASSGGPPPVANPPAQGRAGLDPDLEAFLRNIQ